MQRTVTIPAYAEYVEPVRGKYFALISSTAAVDVELDQNGKETLVPGRKVVVDGGFIRIRFFETSGADNVVTFSASNGDITLSSPTTTDGQSTTVTGKNVSTYLKPYGGSLSGSATRTFAGSDNGHSRKAIVVTNLDAAQTLTIQSGGTDCAAVFPGTALILETNASVIVKNSTGNTINYFVCEIYYS
jgi:hypothetical protein